MVSTRKAELWGTVMSGRLGFRMGFCEGETSELGLKEKEPARGYGKGSNQKEQSVQRPWGRSVLEVFKDRRRSSLHSHPCPH